MTREATADPRLHRRPFPPPRRPIWLRRGVALCLLTGALAAGAQTAAPAAPVAAPVSSDMDAELFYQLLLGELELRRNDPGSAYSLVLDAANRTRRPELYRRAVDIALQGRAGNAALSAARQWATVHPNSDEPYRYELQILLALNRPAEVSNALRQIIRLSPPERRNEVIAAIPQTLARSADKTAAAQAAREALAPSLADPATAATTWATLGRLELAQDQPLEALASASRALAQEPGSVAAATLALELLEREQPGALPLVERYVHLPNAPTSHARTGIHLAFVRVLIDQRRRDAAQRELDRLLASAPELPQAWLLKGILLVQSRQPEAAETALQRYLTLSRDLPAAEAGPGQNQAFLQLAQAAEQRGDFVAANAWLDRIENADALLAAQLRRATMLARQGRLDDARRLLRQPAARDDAELRRQYMAEAQMLRDVGQHALAFEAYAAAVERFPDDADLAYEHAMAADKAGRHSDMERLLRALIARQPDFHHAYNALGYSLADRNERLPEAKALIQQALRHAPNDPYILDSLGWVEFRLGNHGDALRILRDAYQRRPDAEIAAHLGEVHWVLNQREAALAVWREGLLLAPDNETLLQTLRRLQVQP